MVKNWVQLWVRVKTVRQIGFQQRDEFQSRWVTICFPRQNLFHGTWHIFRQAVNVAGKQCFSFHTTYTSRASGHIHVQTPALQSRPCNDRSQHTPSGERQNVDIVAKIRRPTRRIQEWTYTQVYIILKRPLIHGLFNSVVCISIPHQVKKVGRSVSEKLPTSFHGLNLGGQNSNEGNEQSHETCSALNSTNRNLNRLHFEHQEGVPNTTLSFTYCLPKAASIPY